MDVNNDGFFEKQDEPVAWKWHQAPVKTQWGDDMVVADIAIGKDHTVSIYCERHQTAKVEAMFTPPQRKPLTDEELRNHYQSNEWLDGVRFAEQFHGIKGES